MDAIVPDSQNVESRKDYFLDAGSSLELAAGLRKLQ